MSQRSSMIQQESGPLLDALPFAEQEYEGRLERLRGLMRERGLDALISFTPENLYYLTGHDTPGYYFYQACVITHDHLPINVLRRLEVSNTVWRGWARLAVGYDDRDDPVAATLGLLDELGLRTSRIGLEASAFFVTPRMYQQLADGISQAGGTVSDGSGLIERLRVIKSAAEIGYIRAGARAVELAMDAAIAACHEGTTENDVAAEMLAALTRAGGEYAGLPPFVTSGPRTGMVHSTWAGRTYQQGDVVVFELPGVIKRYCAALFRCGTVGPPNDEQRHLAATVTEALERVIEAIRPGATSAEVHDARTQVFVKNGYGHLGGHRTAYSVGINYPPDWGEGQIISIWAGDQRPLETGMTFHLVPGLSVFGRFTMVISETVLVTDSGCEVITQYPREAFVV